MCLHFWIWYSFLLYVDDIVIFGKTQKHFDEDLTRLKSQFDIFSLTQFIKKFCRTIKFLGVEIEDTPSGVVIHLMNCIDEVCSRLGKFKILIHPYSSLPVSKGVMFSRSNCPVSCHNIEQMSHFPYCSVLACPSFVVSRTRPDLCYAVNVLSQFQSNPDMFHWDGLLRLLGYVRLTMHYKLNLSCWSSDLIVYIDDYFADNRDDRTLICGQIVTLDEDPVDWRTFKEKSVNLSTMESEFVTMAEIV